MVVLPYMFSSGWAALIAAIVLASLALFAVGAVIGVLNGCGGLRSGMRQLLIGGGAALLVYLIGRGGGALTGVRLGGFSSHSPACVVMGVSAALTTASPSHQPHQSAPRCGPHGAQDGQQRGQWGQYDDEVH